MSKIVIQEASLVTPFASEDELQTWLGDRLRANESLADIIANVEEFKQSQPASDVATQLFESFSYALASLYDNTIITENQNISLSKTDVLKPDFLLYSSETQSIVIVELKNIKEPTRQAGTEVSAYAAEIKTHLSLLADGDLVNVIVSPVWPALLQHYVIHEICWIGRKIICLEVSGDAKNPRLEIKDINSFGEVAAKVELNQEQLGGYQLCLYARDWGELKKNRDLMDPFLSQMKTALSAIAVKGNELGSHGFAFLWKDGWIESLAPYSIQILNIAAFPGVIRMLESSEAEELSLLQSKFLEIIEEYDPIGHGQSLQAIADEALPYLKGFSDPHFEGFTTWKPLRQILEQRADLISFVGWGLFGQRHMANLREEYSNGNATLTADDPHLAWEMLDEMIDLGFKTYWTG